MVVHMATTTATTAPATAAFERAEFSRLFARVKAEMTVLVADAEKKRPLYSKTPTEAAAKRDAALKALETFIAMVDQAKTKA